MGLARPVEDVERLPDVLADHGVDERRGEAVEVDRGEVAEMLGLGLLEPGEHALGDEDRDRRHEHRHDQRDLDGHGAAEARSSGSSPHDRDLGGDGVEEARILDAEPVQAEQPQHGLAVWVVRHADERRLQSLDPGIVGQRRPRRRSGGSPGARTA